VIEDGGYSGATLVRPGLEQVRDLAAKGQIEAVLVYRSYAGDGRRGTLGSALSTRNANGSRRC
jgi:hypothetical protein